MKITILILLIFMIIQSVINTNQGMGMGHRCRRIRDSTTCNSSGCKWDFDDGQCYPPMHFDMMNTMT